MWFMFGGFHYKLGVKLYIKFVDPMEKISKVASTQSILDSESILNSYLIWNQVCEIYLKSILNSINSNVLNKKRLIIDTKYQHDQLANLKGLFDKYNP